MVRVTSGDAELEIGDEGAVSLRCAGWPMFDVSGLRPMLHVDGDARAPLDVTVEASEAGGHRVRYACGNGISLELIIGPLDGRGFLLRPTLRNDTRRDFSLNEVVLLGFAEGDGAAVFSSRAERVRVLEQGNYWGRTRWIRDAPDTDTNPGEPNEAPHLISGASENVWVAFDAVDRRAFLAGFQTSERWLGRVTCDSAPDGRVSLWRVGFDGADVRVPAGTTADLEEAVLLFGEDPWELLEHYGDRVAGRHAATVPNELPVSWCSWYPYRLSVTEDRILETARIAADRLKPLGLSVVEVDLGWQSENLPSTFEENARFPGGLRRLADALDGLGLSLGVWTAPFTISEYDPMVQAHPEYLVADASGEPAPYWTWFWEPHGKVHILDLTHPDAQRWLRDRMTSLAERGVRYLKPDFIGCVSHPLARARHDTAIASGGGTEAGRIGARIIRDAVPGAAVLNCGGPEMPGTGAHDLLYTCNDTGNPGYIPWSFHRRNYLSLACHLWKNRRWGIIQPSCLCVGHPGPVEEARLRATAAFLSGGQVDIGDTLQTLPEERWDILTATLPPLGVSARPVDLFEPLPTEPYDYEKTTRGEDARDETPGEHPAGSVWHLHVAAEWDSWDLVGIFSTAGDAASDPVVGRYRVPFDRLGIPADADVAGYEFWSSQYLGTLPGKRVNTGGYEHPGDTQDLLTGSDPGMLDISFFGPGVKLICLRSARSHPWVAGSSFHQSGGCELGEVAWNPSEGVLSGILNRPAGESGLLTLTTAGMRAAAVTVDGRKAPFRVGASESIVVPIVTGGDVTPWRVLFKPNH